MSEKTVTEISVQMKEKESNELLKIWEENNTDEWTGEAFEAIKAILTERGVKIPPQLEKKKDEKKTRAAASNLGSTGLYLLAIWLVASIAIGALRPKFSNPVQIGPITFNLLVLTDLLLTGFLFGSITCFVLNFVNKRKQKRN